MVYEAYQKDKDKDPEGRRALPAFAQMQADALAIFVVDPDLAAVDPLGPSGGASARRK